MIETYNAIITSADITNDAHGCLSAWIDLKFGVTGQAFGGLRLYAPGEWKPGYPMPDFGGRWIWRVLEIAGVSKWSALPDQMVRVKADANCVHAIGHIMNDDWACGTAKCAGGYAATMPELIARGLRLVSEWDSVSLDENYWIVYGDGDVCGYAAIQFSFGITSEEAMRICNPEDYNCDVDDVCTHNVVARIQSVRARYAPKEAVAITINLKPREAVRQPDLAAGEADRVSQSLCG